MGSYIDLSIERKVQDEIQSGKDCNSWLYITLRGFISCHA